MMLSSACLDDTSGKIELQAIAVFIQRSFQTLPGNLALYSFSIGALRLSSLTDQAKLALPAHDQSVSVDAMRFANDTRHGSIIYKLSEKCNRFCGAGL
jgi:hypothetical protein